MTLSAKHLPCKHEGPSLILRTVFKNKKIKKLDMITRVCNLNAGEAETGRSLSQLSSRSERESGGTVLEVVF